jgi:hypothetical protein
LFVSIKRSSLLTKFTTGTKVVITQGNASLFFSEQMMMSFSIFFLQKIQELKEKDLSRLQRFVWGHF